MKIRTKIISLIVGITTFAFVSLIFLSYWQLGLLSKATAKQIEITSKDNVKQLQNDVEKSRKGFVNQQKEYLRSQLTITMSMVEKAYKDAHDPEKIKLLYEAPLENVVNTAYSILQDIQSDASIAADQKKDVAMQRIKALRYGPENKDYLWINDLNPTMVMHPYKSALDGKDLTGFKDPNGKHLFVEMVKVCKQNGKGFVDYYWPKYGADKPQPKLSFVKLFEPWGWIIGSGVYLEVAEEKLKADTIEMIKALRYGPENKDYFWINSLEPRMIMHPYKPQLDGKMVADVKDPNDKYLFLEFVDICREKGGGFVDYHWAKYGATLPQPKLSFVRLFAPWGWIIGTGVYVDHIDTMVEQQKRVMEKRLTHNTAKMQEQMKHVQHSLESDMSKIIVVLLALSIFIVLGLGLWIARSIIKPLRQAIEFTKKVAIGDLTDRFVYQADDEIGELSKAMGQMADEMEQRAAMAEAIAVGDLSSRPKVISENDMLGKALAEMVTCLRDRAQLTKDIADGDLGCQVQIRSSQDSFGKAMQQMVDGFKTRAAMAEAIADGDLSQEVAVHSDKDLFGQSLRKMVSGLQERAKLIEAIADGELTHNVKPHSERDMLGISLQKMVANLSSLIGDIQRSADLLADATEEVSNVVDELSVGAQEVTSRAGSVSKVTEEISGNIASIAAASEQSSATIGNVSTTAEEISVSMDTVAIAIEEMSTSIRSVGQTTQDGAKVAAEAINKSGEATKMMEILGNAAQEIGKVTDVIKSISEQTNMLALNATIEAASAGEAGKGFAVVASEVKELAQQSAEAAEDIASRIEGIQRDTIKAVEIIKEVYSIISTVNDSVKLINRNAEEQSSTTNEIAANVVQVNLATNNIARSLSEISLQATDTSKMVTAAAENVQATSKSIHEVYDTSQISSHGVDKIKSSTDELNKVVVTLREQMEHFRF